MRRLDMTKYTVSVDSEGTILYAKGKNAVLPASAIVSETRVIWQNQLRFLVSAWDFTTHAMRLTIRLEAVRQGMNIVQVLDDTVFNGVKSHASLQYQPAMVAPQSKMPAMVRIAGA